MNIRRMSKGNVEGHKPSTFTSPSLPNETMGTCLSSLRALLVELSHPDAELAFLEVFYHKIYKIFPTTEKIKNRNDQYWLLRAEEVELSHPDAELTFLEVFYHKIYKIFPTTEKIEKRNDQYLILWAEEIPDEEKDLHFNKEAAQNHTWKFAFISLGFPEYLEDLAILSIRFQQRYGAWELCLGLDHSDCAPKRPHAAHQMEGKEHILCLEESEPNTELKILNIQDLAVA